VISLFSFALANTLLVAVIAIWMISIARHAIDPLYTAWVNQRLESRVRATVLSMSAQVDAIGQVTGGPVVGMIGSQLSVQAALFASALTLSPVLLLYPRAIRLNAGQVVQSDPAITEK
jgi:DHA3 family tetracycline resistance protein-like MFS transporter